MGLLAGRAGGVRNMTRVSDYAIGSGSLPAMKIRIDPDLCTGHGRCYALAPALFTADDEGFGVVVSEDVPEGRGADARRAVASCPERAVILET